MALQSKSVCSFDSKVISAMLGRDLARHIYIRDGDAGCTYMTPIGTGDAVKLSTSTAG